MAQAESLAFAVVGVGIMVFLLTLRGRSRADAFPRNVIALAGFVMLLCGQYARRGLDLMEHGFVLGVAAIALGVAIQASRNGLRLRKP
jgi:hypothetical protein